MMYRLPSLVLLITLMNFGLASCGAPLVRRKQVDFCLNNSQGMADFATAVAEIAHAENLTIRDESEMVAADVNAIGSQHARSGGNVPLVSITLSYTNGFSLTFTNLGLADYQMAAGFAAAADDISANDRTDRIIRRLDARWPTRHTSEGSGTLPDPDCGR